MKRCAKRPADKTAWEEFIRRFHPLIVASVSKAYEEKRLGKAVPQSLQYEKAIDDLVEAVYQRLVENRSEALNWFEANQTDSIYRYVSIISYKSVFNYTEVH